jgi:ubiquinone/menaquinone biosynthesis C-methylase UbiE
MTALPDELSVAEWHTRFRVQADWTQSIRQLLYNKIGITPHSQVLDVGCGTGVLTAEIHHQNQARTFGLDLARNFLTYARTQDSQTRFIQGDGHRLPFISSVFDLTYCHFFLLWVHDPSESLVEMTRVTRPGGTVLALAEPDYGGRIDYPQELAELGQMQLNALRNQGADPWIGRKLAALFLSSGLIEVQTGILGGEWHHPDPGWSWESEWKMLEADLKPVAGSPDLQMLFASGRKATQDGSRVLFVPTFYAIGKVT